MQGNVFAKVNWDEYNTEFRKELKEAYGLPDAIDSAFYMNKTYANMFGARGEFSDKERSEIKLKYLPAIIARPDISYETAIDLTASITTDVLKKLETRKETHYFSREAPLVRAINQNPEQYVKICKERFGSIYLEKSK